MPVDNRIYSLMAGIAHTAPLESTGSAQPRMDQAPVAPLEAAPAQSGKRFPALKFGMPGQLRKRIAQIETANPLTGRTRIGRPFGLTDVKPPVQSRPATGLRQKLVQVHQARVRKTSLEDAAAARAALFRTGATPAASPGMAEALAGPPAFAQAMARRFGVGAATTRLSSRLLDCAAPPRAGGAGAADLLRPVLLLHAFATQQVPKPGGGGSVDAGVDDVQAAFDYMTGAMDWRELAGGPPKDRAAVLAWRTAEVLARTDEGCALLADLMHVAPPPAEREALRTMLQAIDHLRATPAMRGHEDASTQAVSRRAPALGDSLARRVVLASAARLDGNATAGGADAKGDLFAWRQGFRDDGPGSPLAALRGRACKFVRKAVPRAENRGAGKLLNNLLGRKKSALDGLRLGTQGAHLGSIPKEAKKYCQAFQGACARLSDALELMDGAGAAAGRPPPARRAAVIAQLRAWAQLHNPATTDAFSLDPRLADDIGVPADAPVTVDLLARMARGAGLPAARVAQDVKTAGEIERGADLAPKAMRREKIAATLDRIAADMQSSSRLKLNRGGVHGLSTNGASATLSALTQVVPVSLRVNLRGERARHATFELARSAHGFEVFVGTTRGARIQAGAGARLGWDIDMGGLEAKAGPGFVYTPYDQDDTAPRGVIFRIAPPARNASDEPWASIKYDEQAMIATTRKLLAFLVDEDNAGLSEKDLWNALAERFGDGVSVGWQDGRGRTDRQKIAADVGVSVSVGGGDLKLRGRARAAVAFERVAMQATSAEETGGTEPLVQRKVGNGMAVQAGVRAGVGVGGRPASDAEIASGGIGGFSADVVAFEHGQSVKLNLPTLDGRLFDRACFIDTEFSNVDAFVHKIGQERDKWVRMFAGMHARDRTQAPLTPALMADLEEADLEAGAARLDAFIAKARANTSPNTRLLVRERIAPQAARAYDRYATIARQAGGGPGAGDCAGKQRELLAAPTSWLPHKLALSTKMGRKDVAGLRAGVRAFTQLSADGTHELLVDQFS